VKPADPHPNTTRLRPVSMLKKEHIKQAIEAIADRNAEIGYALDEMLGMGRIHLASPDAEIPAGEDFLFYF
jgi:hypothetical protein